MQDAFRPIPGLMHTLCTLIHVKRIYTPYVHMHTYTHGTHTHMYTCTHTHMAHNTHMHTQYTYTHAHTANMHIPIIIPQIVMNRTFFLLS